MDLAKSFRFMGIHLNSLICKFVLMVIIVLVCSSIFLSPVVDFDGFRQKRFFWVLPGSSLHNLQFFVRRDKFLEVPQIVWGLNNQKIAFARACLTARMLNRTLLMPSLSASLFYKEIDLLEPVWFDKIFQFEKFNSICDGFVRLGRFSDLTNQTQPFELIKGSGRKWTMDRDLDQLKQCNENPIDEHEVIRIVGKNPFLWHDHWPVKDYAKIFECLVLVDEIADEAARVVSKIREIGTSFRKKYETHHRDFDPREFSYQSRPYIAVHMRIERDWMIHCKKLEQRSNISQICSSKAEVVDRVANITGLRKPIAVYIAVADDLLEDPSILDGWQEGLVPLEKKKLGVLNIYKKYPYLIQSAIDYEVCLRADIFVGNSFSTFSSLIVLERTQKLYKLKTARSCSHDMSWASYAYNILGESGGPQRWITDMSDSSLRSISHGSNNISC